MILTKLRLENFKRYQSYEIEFGEGLVGIIGKNGSGKSTIFEAILFALYGEFKNRGEKELVRNSDATTKDIVLVELEFEFYGVLYKVVREFRGKALSANAKFYKNEELTTSGAREVTTSITTLTKMSKDAFMHTLFASQKELTSLSSLKNEDRKKMIRRLLGLEKIDFIEKELVEKSRELKRTILAFDEILLGEEELTAKNSQVKEIKTESVTLLKQNDRQTRELDIIKKTELEALKELEIFVKTKETKQKALSKLELIKTTLDADSKTKEKLLKEIQNLEAKEEELKKLSFVKETYTKLKEQLKKEEQLKEFHLKKEGLVKEQVQLREQYTKTSNDIATLKKECEISQELLLQEKLLKDSLNSLKETQFQTQKKERELNALLSSEQRVIDDSKGKIAKIQNLGSDSACPTCTRPLLEEYDNVLNSLQNTILQVQKEKIEKYSVELTSLGTTLKELQTQIVTKEKERQELSNHLSLIQSKTKDLQKAQEHFQKVKLKGISNKDELEKLKEYSYDATNHQKLQEEIKAIQAKYELVLSLETQLQRKTQLNSEYKNISEKTVKESQVLQLKESDFKLINYNEIQHKDKAKECEEIQKAKDEKAASIHTLSLTKAKLDGELKTIQNTLENNELQLKKVQSKKNDLTDYEKIKLSLLAFKTKLNAKVAPRISNIASNMYAKITKGKYQHIEVDNDFNFFIYDDGKKYPIERFSGGEVDLANLVLRIAISQTLTELSGADSIGFLAFDEVFGSQDEARRMEIIEAFHTIKEQYRQIFLISHEMDIKEMFERVVEL